MSAHPPPQSPLADWPVQHTISAGYIWYTEPGALVTQAHVAHVTRSDTLEMTRCVDTILRVRQAELSKLGGLLILHDWRSLKTWDNASRQLILDRLRDRSPKELRTVIIATSVNPLFRMLAQVANVTVAALGGARVQLVSSYAPLLLVHGITRPPGEASFPGDA